MPVLIAGWLDLKADASQRIAPEYDALPAAAHAGIVRPQRIEHRGADHVIGRREAIPQNAALRVESSPQDAIGVASAAASAVGDWSGPARREAVCAAPARIFR